MKRIKLFVAAAAMFLAAASAWAQSVVTGTVTDSSGEALQGVAVFVEGSTNGSLTGPDGKYSVKVAPDATLTFSMLGFTTVAEPVGGRSVINVTLQDDSTVLDETIVVAFGTSTKEAFTGSAGVVNSDQISRVQNANVIKALEGSVAGVQMTTSSGTLGTTPTIVIRGVGSINAGNGPLYVVDGVPTPNTGIINLNPADIESMTVLKDAASNALYGARGANGVIMITTKRGKSGDATVNVDAKWGFNSKALQDYEYVKNPANFYEARYSALYYYYINGGKSPEAANRLAAEVVAGPSNDGGVGYQIYTVPEGQYFIGTNGKINPNATLGRIVPYNGTNYYLTSDDWMKEVYKPSFRHEYNVNVSGSTAKANFMASLGYLKDNGIIDNASMRRYSLRLKADYQAKKWLKVGGNASYAHYGFNNGNTDEGEDGSTGNVFSYAALVPCIYPVYIRFINSDGKPAIMSDEMGYKRYDYGAGDNAGLVRPNSTNSNALQTLTLDKESTEGNAVNGTGYADIILPLGFKIQLNGGIGLDEYRGTSMNNMYYGQFATNGGTLWKEHDRIIYYNLQQLLSWTYSFGSHNVSVLLGHENYDYRTYMVGGYKTKLFSLDNDELNSAVVDGQSAESTRTQYLNEGYFARALYDYDNRIFASASFRRDASSRFHPKHRWGNFWSLGASWLIDREPWFNASWVDMLKIKASIGSQGNDSISNYLYTDRYSLSNNEGEIAIAFGGKGNENISWETNTNFNAGIEFDLFGGRLSGGFEYFYRKTSDMLFYFSVPRSLGYGGYYDNIGDMRNSGIELSLDGALVRTKDIELRLNANLTHFTNKVLRLPEKNKTQNIEGYPGYIDGSRYIGEGLPRYTWYMRDYAGIDHETGEALWYINEVDDDGNPTGKKVTTTDYSSADKYLCGDPTPKIYGGFGLSFQAYGFDLSAQFTYQVGGLCYDNGYANLVRNPATGNIDNIHRDVLNAWTPENKDSDFPRYVYLDQYYASTSSRFLISASYLNFQNAQIGYTFPAKWTEKIKVKRLRIYATCDNIWYVSKRKGLDPRYSLTGVTNSSHNSPVRTLSGGINITF